MHLRPPPRSTLFPYTTLFRSALGVTAPVTSPTYTIGHRYEGEPDVSHLDLYRFTGVSADRKSTRLNSSHLVSSYAVFCLKKKINIQRILSTMISRGDKQFTII